MKRLLKSGAVTLVALIILSIGGYAAFDRWSDGQRAERAMSAQNAAEALRLYDKALAHSFWPANYRARMLSGRGLALLTRGKDDQAFADFDSALKIAPATATALSLRGVVHARRREWQPALDDMNAALAISPQDTTLLLHRALFFTSILDIDRSIADFATIRSIDPNNRGAYSAGAYALARQGKTALASQLIADMPMEGMDDAEAHAQKAIEFSMVGAQDLALRSINTAIRLAPKDASNFRERAVIYSSMGETALAFDDFDQAIKLDPTNYRAWLTRGREYFFLGNYHAAAENLDQAIDRHSKHFYDIIWWHLANVHLGKNDQKELVQFLNALYIDSWPLPIVEFFTGKRDEASMRAAATEKVSPAVAYNQLCEATYYAAELKLAQGQRAKALPQLREAAATCPPDFVELYAARRELKAMGE